MRYLSSRRGFTLVELVVVLAIIALAAATATISIGRSSEKAVIRDEARGVQLMLRHARHSSLMGRVPVSFVYDSDLGAYWLVKGEKPLGRQHALSRGLRMFADEDIIFFPKGNSTGGSVTLRDGAGRGYLIEVDRVTGLARIRRV